METDREATGPRVFVLALAVLSLQVPARPATGGVCAYVTNNVNGGEVSVINTATQSLQASVVGTNVPNGIAVAPNGLKAYATRESPSGVVVIDTNTNTISTVIPGGNNLNDIDITANGAIAYVANSTGGSSPGAVTIFDLIGNFTVNSIAVGTGPAEAALTPNGTRLYVTNVFSQTVSVIDTTNNSVMGTIPVAGATGVAITPNGSTAYVTGLNNVVAINTGTNAIIATIPAAGPRGGIAITPDGTRAYAARASGSGTVAVIDTSSNTLIDTISVGPTPDGVAITPDGAYAYVVQHTIGNPVDNSTGGYISVINTTTHQVVNLIVVGPSPAHIAMGDVPNGCLGPSTATPTATSSATTTPTVTATFTPPFTATSTYTSTETETATPTATPTSTSAATSTPTATFTGTATATPTSVAPIPLCGSGPFTCKTAGFAKLLLKNKADPDRDRFKFQWLAGQATTLLELGDPTMSTQYTLCVWDETAGVPQLAMEMVAMPAGNCVGQPCWRRAGSGYRYRDPGLLPDGIRSVTLKPRGEGKARIQVIAAGMALPDPSMPFDQDARIVVQLINSAGSCWGTDFVTPALVNSADKLIARERP